MKKRNIALITLLITASFTSVFAGGSKEIPGETDTTTQEATTQVVDVVKDDLSENITLKFNLSYGNKSRTMTYNQSSPLTLSNGDVITAGMLKPVWSDIAEKTNSTFYDVSIQDAKATDMIKTASASNFSDANIFGGNSIATELMAYGAQGKFVALNELMDQGLMPNFKAYLDANPDVKKSITTYDGNIYQVPYIAEVGNFARTLLIRESWVTDLLDRSYANYDTDKFTTYYDGFFVNSNARKNTVTPKEGLSITKKTNQSIIEIQNNLSVKNGKTLTQAFIKYIDNNYDYDTPSELFIGEKAAYDMDELIALFRCVKANPQYLTDGKADEVWPFFTRKSSYREDLLRLATYFDGVEVHGSDSYASRWYIDENGQIQFTYTTEEMYDSLARFSDLFAEGLLYSDCFDLSNKSNFRSILWGTDDSETASYGFLTYDWIASSTSDSLNSDTIVILPPVAKVNGVWQYYIGNSRVIKNDGWVISKSGSTDKQIRRAATVMDYYFSADGQIEQNYGLLEDIDKSEKYIGPAGKEWPKFDDWVLEAANKYASGDISRFLRDWEGALMPIGYPKQIGFEYQSTSQRGFEGWALLKASTTNFPTYAGDGIKGDNPNYYKLIPPSYSLTPRQSETIDQSSSLSSDDDVTEYIFNVIRYATLNNAPSGTDVAMNYDEYLKFFTDRGLDIYISTYQNAYQNMK
ncbi:MAG: hypothetical protein ACPKM0_08325 [Pleomorphochaeta sp.]